MPSRKLQIVVCKLGWVLVGETVERENYLALSDASVIRRWGTSKGLGEIALGGPTPSTIMDKIGEVRVQYDAVLFVVDCVESKWPR
jgi:hypothetical protein